jgi:hypothetical protein
MAQFFRTNSNASIGGGARVLIVNPIGTYKNPTRLSEIVSLTTYDPVTATYGWKDIGSTKTPSRVQLGYAKTDWNNEQTGLYRGVVGNWTGQTTCEALEMTSANKKLLYSATIAAANGVTGEVRTNFPARSAGMPFVRLAFLTKDHLGNVHASIFPKAQWDGGAIAETLARTDSRSIPMTWALYADENEIDSETGDPIIRYDIDQEYS